MPAQRGRGHRRRGMEGGAMQPVDNWLLDPRPECVHVEGIPLRIEEVLLAEAALQEVLAEVVEAGGPGALYEVRRASADRMAVFGQPDRRKFRLSLMGDAGQVDSQSVPSRGELGWKPPPDFTEQR